MDKNKNIIEIENEYKRIDSDWLRLHFNTSISLVVFGLFIQTILGFLLYKMDQINIGILHYIMKYSIVPLIINAFFLVIGYWTINSSRITEKFKVYIISLLFVMICFVFFTVHSVFISIYLIFTICILFTVVYCNYMLTTVTALFSIFAKIFSDVFITWDPDKSNIWDNDIAIANFILSIICMLAFYAVCLVVVRFEKEKNIVSIQKELERQEFRLKLQKDELTSLNNRTSLRNAFQSMEEDLASNKYIFVMVDVDNFKLINDTLGHSKGDHILIEFGNILKSNCDENATPFRFGGDEFCILVKNKKLDAVVELCKKIQKDYSCIGGMGGIQLLDTPLTVSFGIAKYEMKTSTTHLLKNADFALYISKKHKNDIQIYKE